MQARNAAIIGIGAALVVGGIAIAKRRDTTVVLPATETTHAVRIVRRDRSGLPEKQGVIRDPVRVRAITSALGVDAHPSGECPPDYAAADFGIVLAGSDVYVRRNVYVFGLVADGDAGTPSPPFVVSVTSAGCRVGPPADVAALRSELRAAKTLD
jgi:hypothetical protein